MHALSKRMACTLFNTAGMHAPQHGYHARSLKRAGFKRLACTLFNSTRLACTLFNTLECNDISSCDLTKIHGVMHALSKQLACTLFNSTRLACTLFKLILQHGWHVMTYHHIVI